MAEVTQGKVTKAVGDQQVIQLKVIVVDSISGPNVLARLESLEAQVLLTLA